jgi:hypothetical protein
LFLVTTCFDWGPVVLQHLLMVSGALCLVRFHQERRPGLLAAGFFLFGWALWDKSLFAWMLSGMAVAALLVVPKELWNSFNLRNLALASAAFCLGAAPLIYYNVCFPLQTLRANAAYTADDVRGKSHLLSAPSMERTVRYGPGDDLSERAKPSGNRGTDCPGSAKSRTQAAGFFPTPCSGRCCSSWLWSTPARPMLFSLIAMAVA